MYMGCFEGHKEGDKQQFKEQTTENVLSKLSRFTILP